MNYKIRVNNEEESEEAQELFFELGYVWHDTKCKTQMRYVEPVYYSSFDDMELACDVSDVNYKHKEITLPGLRALVSLHKNPINMDKVLSGVRSDALGLLEEKEWLNIKTYEYKKAVDMGGHSKWIEIPEGAEICTKYDGSNEFYKSKNGIVYRFDECCWIETNWDSISEILKECERNNFNVLWKRHTQPEELPFVDDEPKTKIGELYVDLEVNVDVDINSSLSKHNHYFIDVSDVDEVDFYEIALRYNVTDPCIQHILKKCLAAGNRGHKDFHTDLKDIYDTAVRALRIHGG